MLIIHRDLPKRCADCLLFSRFAWGQCRYSGRWFTAEEGDFIRKRKPDWCALQEADEVIPVSWLVRRLAGQGDVSFQASKTISDILTAWREEQAGSQPDASSE